MGKQKVVLAFSGGLDTSYCVKYLSEDKGLEVHSVLVDTGGFSAEELQQIEAKAISLGVATHKTVNETTGVYHYSCQKRREYIAKAIKFLAQV
jgi:argininosuccinate synthase